jgi:hypothetical protein
MPDLKSELTGSTRPPLEFAITTPPGWARFAVDEAAEAQLTGNMEALFRDRGQPRELLGYRTQVHKMFLELRRRNALAIYLPVEPVGDIVLPLSIVILPAPVRDEAGIEHFARRVAARGEMTSAVIDGLRVLRWEQRSAVTGEEGASALTINHLFEAPHGSGRSAAIVTGALLYLDGAEGDDFAQSLEELLQAIASTFTWGVRP